LNSMSLRMALLPIVCGAAFVSNLTLLKSAWTLACAANATTRSLGSQWSFGSRCRASITLSARPASLRRRLLEQEEDCQVDRRSPPWLPERSRNRTETSCRAARRGTVAKARLSAAAITNVANTLI
jgi:hypothetical protein